jgi:signal transduction histidine kinase
LEGDGEESALIADSYNKMVEALQKINDLEKRHSVELANANQRLEKEIAERERAEREIRHLSRKLMTGIEDAQKNLAQDLHDEFGQTLAALHMGVESLWKSMPEEMVDQKRSIAELIDLIEQLGDKIRSISSDLRPDLLDDLGLVPTIEWYLKEFSDRNPGIRTDFQAVGMKKRFALELELVLYRIFQESLNNVVKHARATHVGVRLTNSYPKVILLVQDDGVGFSPNQRSAGIGLIGMRERAVSMDGALDIRSVPEKGTTVRVELPVLKEGDRHEQNPGNDRRRSRGGAGGVA